MRRCVAVIFVFPLLKKSVASIQYIREELIKREAVTDRTGERIIAGVANYEYEGSVYPYILIHKNGDARTVESFEGTRVLTEYLVISCRADVYAESDELGK